MEPEAPFVKNAASPKQVAAAGRKARFKHDRELEDLKEVLSTKPGQRLIWRYIERCGVYTFASGDVGLVNFNEGRRSAGLEILKEVNEISPEVLISMMQEHSLRRRKDNEDARA